MSGVRCSVRSNFLLDVRCTVLASRVFTYVVGHLMIGDWLGKLLDI